ncbi:MAG TPA: hypothetical protein VG103_10650 [Chthoniobacterales bacterium]|jgi:hypothetical protein|nr:hypothetical protein [Chthoniobacterales bacterium]
MQKPLGLFLAIGLSVGLPQSPAQDAGKWEKIADVSPDKKLGVRITCESEPDDSKKIDPDSIAAVELVALPSKKRVMELSRNYDGAPAKIFWSQDSNWFALAVSEGPRVTETSVFHRDGNEFEKLDAEDLRVETKGDVRNEYIEPVRWLKPGTLLLKQITIFRGEAGDSTIEFTVRFYQYGKFRVIGKKKLQSKGE